MRIAVATVGDGPEQHGALDVFLRLARLDAVGEHELTRDPESADALLVVNLQQLPDDPYLRALRQSPLVEAHFDKVYVYDQRDRPFFTFPGIYVSGAGRWARRLPLVGGPYPNLPNAPELANQAPDLLFSFLGARTHPVRAGILALEHPRSIVEDTSALNCFPWVSDEDPDDRLRSARTRYRAVVGRSKFVLCPRGHGPSSFRLYETLCAGRVPVVISDDWLAPPRVNWGGCVLRVPERDVQRLPQILEEYETRWPIMVTAGQAAVSEHFSSTRLWHHIAASITNLMQVRRPRTPWWAQSQVIRIWARTMVPSPKAWNR